MEKQKRKERWGGGKKAESIFYPPNDIFFSTFFCYFGMQNLFPSPKAKKQRMRKHVYKPYFPLLSPLAFSLSLSFSLVPPFEVAVAVATKTTSTTTTTAAPAAAAAVAVEEKEEGKEALVATCPHRRGKKPTKRESLSGREQLFPPFQDPLRKTAITPKNYFAGRNFLKAFLLLIMFAKQASKEKEKPSSGWL